MKIKAINTWQHAQRNLLYREKESWSDYQKVYPILENNGIFLFNYGAELSAGGYYKESLVVLRNAKQFFTSASLHLHLGNNYKALKNYKMAEKEYQIAHYMVPNLFFPLNCLLELYKEKKETKKALEVALKIHHMPIKVYSDQVKGIKKNALVYLYGSK